MTRGSEEALRDNQDISRLHRDVRRNVAVLDQIVQPYAILPLLLPLLAHQQEIPRRQGGGSGPPA